MRMKNLLGKKFNMLTVFSRGDNTSFGNATWNCKCSCGNIVYNVAGTNLIKGTKYSCGCITKSKINYYNKIKKLFEDNGCICLETEYKPAKSRWRFICKCGNKSDILPDDFKKRKRCQKCGYDLRHKKITTPYEEIESYFNHVEDKLLEVYYNKKRQRINVVYECKNNHVNDKPFYLYKKYKCKKCSDNKRAEEQKLSIEYIKKELGTLGLEYIGGYENIDLPITYKCSCGNIAKGYLPAIKKGIRCGCGYKKGEENPNWNHNLSKEERLLRRSYPEYKEWVKTVFVRDNYTCQVCWSFGNRLHAHHLEPYSISKEKRLDLNNGVTLCEDCHREFHSIYGINTCNTDDYYDYLDFTKERRFW